MRDNNVILNVENLSKLYRLGTIGTGSFSTDIKRFWKTKILQREDPYLQIGKENNRSSKQKSDAIWALKDVNFQVRQGEVLGIIGKNGAGKSTLLKLLSRITSPTTGTIEIFGRMVSLLEVGTGFHPELTGRENIFLNGAILGMTKAEIKRKLDEIIDFSGCELFIDTPVKRYSSGMTVRLGFAVAAFLEPEILIVDEVLAVGDAEFQKKAIGKMKDVSEGAGRTVLFVSHNMAAVSSLCNKGLLIKNGKIEGEGPINNVIEQYLHNESYGNGKYVVNHKKNDKIFIKSIFLTDSLSHLERTEFFHDEEIVIKFEISGDLDKWNVYSLFCTILNLHGVKIFSSESKVLRSYSITLHMPANTLVRGEYLIEAFIHIPNLIAIDMVENVCRFSIIDRGSNLSIHGDYDYGLVFVNAQWKY